MSKVPRKKAATHLLEKHGLKIDTHHLDYLRREDRGPAYYRIGGRVFYDAADLAAWIEGSYVKPSGNVTDGDRDTA